MPRDDAQTAEATHRAAGRLGRADLPAFALTIVIGTAGGAAFDWLDLPLPWMLGAMFATGAVTLSGVRTCVDGRLRTVMILILGILLGGAFSPEILDRMTLWPVTLLGLFVFVLLGTLATYAYFRIAGFDPTTAFFAGVPGGLNEMVIMGEANGADVRQVSVTHTTRIFLVVMILPFLFRIFGDLPPGVRTFSDGGHGIGPLDVALLLGCAIAGLYAARAMRIPAPHLTGPMIASAGVHLAGLTEASPPLIVVATAQVVIGASVGTRFAGLSFRDLGRILRLGGVATLILLAISAVFSVAMDLIVGQPIMPLILAYSPGGFTEMSLVALALDIDTAFVASHHIARIAFVVTVIPIAFRLMRRRGMLEPKERQRGPSSD